MDARRHRCLADPTCAKRLPYQDWCCLQHRALLVLATGDWRVHARVQSAWQLRVCEPERYVEAKKAAFAALAKVDPKARAAASRTGS